MLLLLLACTAPTDTTPVRVFAASSLTEVFTAVADDFERAHPDIDVQPVFAGSQVLRLQIEHGAAADVFAPADPRHLEPLEQRGHLTTTEVFATNQLVVVVPRDSAIERFDQLDRAERIVVGSPQVPIGSYTRTALERARAALGEGFVDRVQARIASEEVNVRLVRAKVELGEADAAFVYRTDALGSPKLRAVELPAALQVQTRYPVARLEEAPSPDAGDLFIAHLLGTDGQDRLSTHGFGGKP